MVRLEHLKKLAQLKRGRFPFISLYFNHDWTDPAQIQKSRIFLKKAINKHLKAFPKHSPESKSFEADVRRISKFLKKQPPFPTRGLAIFACRRRRIFETFQWDIAPQNEFYVGESPRLFPLVLMADEYEPVGVVIIDRHQARIFYIAQGKIIWERNIVSFYDFDRTKAGGWSQARYQRHVDAHIKWHLKKSARKFLKLFRGKGLVKIVLGGTPQTLAEFRKYLPQKKFQEVACLKLDVKESQERILDTVSFQIQKLEREEEHQKLKALFSGRSPVALKIPEVLEAFQMRKVQALFLAENFKKRAWQCQSCLSLSPSFKVECPFCKARLLVVDLAEALVKKALNQGAGIEIVKGQPQFLQKTKGVAAILRF